jgi:hypothetical protein
LTTGEVGKVAGAAAPQFAFEESVVVVVVADVVVVVVLVVEIADNVQAVAWAVPPTVLNRMTRPRRAATNNARGAARKSTFFTVVPSLRAKGSESVAQAKGEKSPAPRSRLVVPPRGCGLRSSLRAFARARR